MQPIKESESLSHTIEGTVGENVTITCRRICNSTHQWKFRIPIQNYISYTRALENGTNIIHQFSRLSLPNVTVNLSLTDVGDCYSVDNRDCNKTFQNFTLTIHQLSMELDGTLLSCGHGDVAHEYYPDPLVLLISDVPTPTPTSMTTMTTTTPERTLSTSDNMTIVPTSSTSATSTPSSDPGPSTVTNSIENSTPPETMTTSNATTQEPQGPTILPIKATVSILSVLGAVIVVLTIIVISLISVMYIMYKQRSNGRSAMQKPKTNSSLTPNMSSNGTVPQHSAAKNGEVHTNSNTY